MKQVDGSSGIKASFVCQLYQSKPRGVFHVSMAWSNRLTHINNMSNADIPLLGMGLMPILLFTLCRTEPLYQQDHATKTEFLILTVEMNMVTKGCTSIMQCPKTKRINDLKTFSKNVKEQQKITLTEVYMATKGVVQEYKIRGKM